MKTRRQGDEKLQEEKEKEGGGEVPEDEDEQAKEEGVVGDKMHGEE